MEPVPPAYDETPTPAPLSTPKGMICVSFNMSDRIRLIGAPGDVAKTVRTAILEEWDIGIQQERDYAGSHEFKVKGNPWDGYGSSSYGVGLVRSILQSLRQIGYKPMISIDSSVGQFDKSAIYLEPTKPENIPYFGMGLESSDSIRLIGFPPDLLPLVEETITNTWKKGIQRQTVENGAHRLKLRGNPWSSSSEEAVYSRELLMALISALNSRGWRAIASVDLSGSKQDKDSLFFSYENPS